MSNNKTKKRSRSADVLKYLQTHKRGISSGEGSVRFKTRNFPDVIYKLKKQGHDIETVLKDGSNEYGHYTYAVYIYRGGPA